MSEYRKGMLYAHNVLEGFGNGCIMDLRVRMANELLKSPAFMDISNVPAELAEFALDLAEEITSQAAERGWLVPIPEDGELTPALKNQARLTASYSVLQQIEGQKFAQGEQGQVIPAAPGGLKAH